MLNSPNRKLIRLLETLRDSNATVIVEGKNDALALRDFAADFLQLNNKNSQSEFLNVGVCQHKTNNGKSLYETAEMFAMKNKKAILMFDADRKGLQLGRLFKTYLQQNGVCVNDKIGRDILKAAKVRHVEHLRL